MSTKKASLGASALVLMFAATSCGGGAAKPVVQKPYTIETTETVVPEQNGVPEYTILTKTQVDMSSFPQDKDGFYTIFDGKSFYG